MELTDVWSHLGLHHTIGSDLNLILPIESLKDDDRSNTLSAMLEYLDSLTGSEETNQLVEEEEVFQVEDESKNAKKRVEIQEFMADHLRLQNYPRIVFRHLLHCHRRSQRKKRITSSC